MQYIMTALFALSNIQNIGLLGNTMQINANANEICKAMTFVGYVPN